MGWPSAEAQNLAHSRILSRTAGLCYVRPMPPVYLDHNATSPLRPEAREAMLRAFDETCGNASSPHAAGRAARRLLDRAREEVACLLGVSPDEIVLTAGG